MVVGEFSRYLSHRNLPTIYPAKNAKICYFLILLFSCSFVLSFGLIESPIWWQFSESIRTCEQLSDTLMWSRNEKEIEGGKEEKCEESEVTTDSVAFIVSDSVSPTVYASSWERESQWLRYLLFFCFRDCFSCIDGRLEPTAGDGRRQKSNLKIITLFSYRLKDKFWRGIWWLDIGVIGVSKIPKSQFIKVHCIANLPTLSDLGA